VFAIRVNLAYVVILAQKIANIWTYNKCAICNSNKKCINYFPFYIKIA